MNAFLSLKHATKQARTISVGVIAAVVTGGILTAATPAAAADTTTSPLGVFVGGGNAGVAAHRDFEKLIGAKVPYAVDFATQDTWQTMIGPNWQLSPWEGSGYRLIDSIGMMTKADVASVGAPAALAACAAGDYDSHWIELGSNLVSHHLADTIMRPGWEMNAAWFPWSATGATSTYISCYQHIVTAMRSVAGQKFAFAWNPSIGAGQFPAEQAYPGDDYVDFIGVDNYDWSWAPGVYDTKATQTPAQRLAAQATVWSTILSGDHGLRFWSSFANTHGKKLGLPEWGLANRFDDNYGGEDNPYFIEQMMKFAYDPASNVEFAALFNVVSPDADHRLTSFPNALAAFQQDAQKPPLPVVPVTPVCAPAAPATTATPYPILTSSDGKYAGGVPLAGSTTGWAIYGWIKASSDIKYVDFWLDNPTASGAALHRESTAPYDFGGTKNAGSAPYDAYGLVPGIHSITAKVTTKTGTLTETVTFTKPGTIPAGCPGSATATTPPPLLTPAAVPNPSPTPTPVAVPTPSPTPTPVTPPATSSPTPAPSTTPPAAPYQLIAAPVGSRANAAALDGTTVSSNTMYAWVAKTPDIRSVRFYVDNTAATGTPVRVELAAPFDLGGTTALGSGGYSISNLTRGAHTVTALVTRSDGSTGTVTATFTKA